MEKTFDSLWRDGRLGEPLNFPNHIKKVEQKANKVIGALRQIKHTVTISKNKVQQLYKF